MSDITQKKNLLSCLPTAVSSAICKIENSHLLKTASELRLRRERFQSLTVGRKNYVLSNDGFFYENARRPLLLSEKELSECVFKLCDGSMFNRANSLREGYVVKDGVRVGICGKSIVKNRILEGFSEYDSLNIRFPRHIPNAANELLDRIAQKGLSSVGGILIIAPPCVGKTTFLRSACSCLSRTFCDGGLIRGARVCVIDEREEIYLSDAFRDGFADFLIGCPKGYGIELATRLMSPEIIACDELANSDEAALVRAAASGGITFIATCHAENVAELYRKKAISPLLEDGIFRSVCVLSEKDGVHACEIISVGESK